MRTDLARNRAPRPAAFAVDSRPQQAPGFRKISNSWWNKSAIRGINSHAGPAGGGRRPPFSVAIVDTRTNNIRMEERHVW
jgi:hypothetical protein